MNGLTSRDPSGAIYSVDIRSGGKAAGNSLPIGPHSAATTPSHNATNGFLALVKSLFGSENSAAIPPPIAEQTPRLCDNLHCKKWMANGGEILDNGSALFIEGVTLRGGDETRSAKNNMHKRLTHDDLTLDGKVPAGKLGPITLSELAILARANKEFEATCRKLIIGLPEDWPSNVANLRWC